MEYDLPARSLGLFQLYLFSTHVRRRRSRPNTIIIADTSLQKSPYQVPNVMQSRNFYRYYALIRSSLYINTIGLPTVPDSYVTSVDA